MKFITNKGAATTEFVLIFPFVVLFLISFFKIYQGMTGKEKELLGNDQTYKEELFKRQQEKPILERPCEVHPLICAGRKP
ncbi:MAG: hypothetical protein A3F82_08545 [Deltaproteobacteria bacterium RIFCSPLOWO2_12_FULL_44_12]|nr:MAG: hypothetical protein A2712_00380 [Deltaproteobacteria bacterium RIFCSPHIGHO2_01_FULL_43_49]OGQ15873.1 MAG: hypothetical protein A3D22_03030 [Deltaproteobacteria bacterium RIFCSPHIGHO2_02_FULL_44_53]OGQ28827.1 MAG: hypothetical protein A3D98_01360 [Deltaproteobacteria bacterium RIFCSPHIGHO2_12_FULL_44_21]OGQ32147.1 MAG: hypothetical protein A2979_03485 [Deltaproteobacteria bacterium RIFCSPLOWO2_01_FULL_45_74]OGQ43710.1 MAG: hypothetical protein A3I70_05505 [Deltaproteobacteria bacterium 